jgi:hypothetical protein
VEPFKDEDLMRTKYLGWAECSCYMAVDRFVDRYPAFKEDEVLFELFDPVDPWIERG